MIVVSDTTAISSLHKIGQLHLLYQLFSEVIIPEQVYEELRYFEIKESGLNLIKVYPWLKVTLANDFATIKSLEETLDIGESAAIALSIQLKADVLLIDEKDGRKIAKQKGIPVVGLVGVLSIAKRKNILNAVKPVLDDLIDVANFRISKALYDRTLIDANEQ